MAKRFVAHLEARCSSTIRYRFPYTTIRPLSIWRPTYRLNMFHSIYRFSSSPINNNNTKPPITSLKLESKLQNTKQLSSHSESPSTKKSPWPWRKILIYSALTTAALFIGGCALFYFVLLPAIGKAFVYILGDILSAIGHGITAIIDEMDGEVFIDLIGHWATALPLYIALTNEEVINAFGTEDICILKNDDNFEPINLIKEFERMENEQDYVLQTKYDIANRDKTVFGSLHMEAKAVDGYKDKIYLKIIVFVKRPYLWDKKIVVCDGVYGEDDIEQHEFLKPFTDEKYDGKIFKNEKDIFLDSN